MELTPAEKKSNALWIGVSQATFNFAAAMVIPVRASMVMANCGGDGKRAAKVLSDMASYAAVCEIFGGPALGAIGDAYGRKVVLLAGPTVHAVLHWLVGANPNDVRINVLDRAVTAVLVGTTLSSGAASLADMYEPAEQPAELAAAQAQMGSMFSLGLMFGPLMGGAIAAKTSPRRAFHACCVFYAASIAVMLTKVKETHKVAKRKAFDAACTNPLRFLQLFKTGTLARLLLASGANDAAGFGNIYDLAFLFFSDECGFDAGEVGRFWSGWGAAMTAGLAGAKTVIPMLGEGAATTLGNLSTAATFYAWANAKNARNAAGMLLLSLPMHARSIVVDSAIVREAGRPSVGLGKGATMAAVGNFKALLKIIWPRIYARLYARSPASPFYFIALMPLLSELIVRSLGKRAWAKGDHGKLA